MMMTKIIIIIIIINNNEYDDDDDDDDDGDGDDDAWFDVMYDGCVSHINHIHPSILLYQSYPSMHPYHISYQ